MKVPLEQILTLETLEVPATDPKLGGCKGCSVRALLGAATSGSGVLTAADGMKTEPLPFETLVQGVLVHTGTDGELLGSNGGPLRAWWPAECGMVCGSGNPLTIKDVRSLTLTVTPPT